MFDSDQVTDSPELRALREALDGVELPARPPIDAIRTRGRARRPYGVPGPVGLAAAGAVAGAALTLAFAGALGDDGASHPAASATTAAGPRAIRTPAYTLISDTSGRVKLTINPAKLFQPAALQSDLARFGIPAKVTSGRYCTSNPAPAGFSRVVTFTARRHPTITIDPKAIRPGTELSVGRFRLRIAQAAMVGLIRTRHFACRTSIAAATRGGGRQLGYYHLPARQATSHG